MMLILLFFTLAKFYISATNPDTCVTRGKFPNDKSPDCRGYSMCLPGAGNVYTQVDLSCPEEFIYSHIDNQCTNSTNYKCFSAYNCTSVGNFKNTASEDCMSYIACIEGLSDADVIDARIIQCPINTQFNPDKGLCVSDISHHCNNNIVDHNTSKEKQEQGNSSNADTCGSPGTFPNDKQADCRGYSKCIPGSGDNWIQLDLTCPIGFIYNHIDRKCTNATSYKCFSTFNCTSLGNFEDPFTDDCTSYIVCIRGLNNNNDIITSRLIHCPPNTIFNNEKGICVHATDFLCDNMANIGEIKTYISLDSPYSRTAAHVYCPYVILMFVSILSFL